MTPECSSTLDCIFSVSLDGFWRFFFLFSSGFHVGHPLNVVKITGV